MILFRDQTKLIPSLFNDNTFFPSCYGKFEKPVEGESKALLTNCDCHFCPCQNSSAIWDEKQYFG